jgi:DNA-binding transcriptional LysR family regulator
MTTSLGRLHIAPHLAPFLAAHPAMTIDLSLSDSFVDVVGEGFDVVAIRIADLAVYPSRRHLAHKVRLFIDFLAALYGPAPYWDRGLSALDSARRAT